MNEFIDDFVHLATDPAHLLLEFLFVVFDYMVISVVVSRVKKHFRKDIADEHQRLDAEHGVQHPEPIKPWELVDDQGQLVKFDLLMPRSFTLIRGAEPKDDTVYDHQERGL